MKFAPEERIGIIIITSKTYAFINTTIYKGNVVINI